MAVSIGWFLPCSRQASEMVSDSEAIRNKYHISKDKYDEFFKVCLRRKLVDFLCNERKRHAKKQQQLHQEQEQHNLTETHQQQQ
ncbi:unnamed protein product [Didymodactylos carnosus]|uniref:Uncharacterized protein n=1 Tax=Didymodactylos carnosus TaxID=1234261 RepID=A0A815R160_9BILA|nr:unnamed protein product [Didymodactylos carnosus]CAF1469177.1 unnamed protein product [Didymodactylos carnosus]CAF4110303.1 unnamed protein product [Didymodactylos carnosus]CAF4337445.1 unnamed protein product [Didymodactylos carnosus]